MPFPRTVRIEAMLAAARHCCLCRRYKGVKLEVHHIQPEAKGGSNDFDNAMVLCFDCHADAGSYNSDHPRGTRIRTDELRRARDDWYHVVRTGAVQPPAELDMLHCRYIVGKSFEALREISDLDFRRFPITNALFVKTPPLAFLEGVLRSHPEANRQDHVWSDDYYTRDAYLKAHADCEFRPTSHEGGFIYFNYERELNAEELMARVAPLDGVSRLLIEAGVPSRQIARALAYEEGCAESFPEIYRVRPLWGVFLAITNVSNQHLSLLSVEGEPSGSGLADFRPMHTLEGGNSGSIRLPEAAIPPSATVVLPVCTVLGPLDHFPAKAGYSESIDLSVAHWQSFTHVTTSEERTLASFAWGPAFTPQHVRFLHDGFIESQSVHELNLSNVYEIDRFWGMGSCPHAFAIESNGAVRYLGEILARGSGKLVQQTIEVPSTATSIVIAELEEELTFLRSVTSENHVLASEQLLRRGEYLIVRAPSSTLTVEGWYLPLTQARTDLPRQSARRNELVGDFRAVLQAGVVAA
jgi:hypothetical protein